MPSPTTRRSPRAAARGPRFRARQALLLRREMVRDGLRPVACTNVADACVAAGGAALALYSGMRASGPRRHLRVQQRALGVRGGQAGQRALRILAAMGAGESGAALLAPTRPRPPSPRPRPRPAPAPAPRRHLHPMPPRRAPRTPPAIRRAGMPPDGTCSAMRVACGGGTHDLAEKLRRSASAGSREAARAGVGGVQAGARGLRRRARATRRARR